MISHLALPLQADPQPSLAAPGAVLHPGAEPVEELLVLSQAVQRAGRVRLLCPLPEVVPATQGLLVVGGALLVPEGEAGGGAGTEHAGPPAVGPPLTPGPLQAHPPSRLETLGPTAPRATRPWRPGGPCGVVQDAVDVVRGDGEGGMPQ